MPATYERPSYATLAARISADLATMPAVLRGPLASAWAMACHGQHGFLEWIDRQCSPLTCDEERLYDWASLYRVGRLPASPAAGTALATGAAGAQILANTALRGPNARDYTVQSAVTLGSGPTPIAVRCTDAGTGGNLGAGASLMMIDPTPGVASTLAIAAPGLTGGAEEESTEDWRARVTDEWQVAVTRGARSGKPEDYRFWARSAHPSITTALVQPHVLGIGTVLVRPICNTLPNRLPTQAVLDAVADYLYNTAPATADWRVAAPIPHYVDITVLLAPAADSSAVRADITAALTAAIATETTEDAELLRSEIDAAISTVTSQYTLAAPAGNTLAAPGEVLVLGTLKWQP